MKCGRKDGAGRGYFAGCYQVGAGRGSECSLYLAHRSRRPSAATPIPQNPCTDAPISEKFCRCNTDWQLQVRESEEHWNLKRGKNDHVATDCKFAITNKLIWTTSVVTGKGCEVGSRRNRSCLFCSALKGEERFGKDWSIAWLELVTKAFIYIGQLLPLFLKTLNRIQLISKPNLTYLIPNNPTNFRILTDY
jgi:hypothetical protein